MTMKPWTDPIVAEVRQWRKELLEESDNDFDTFFDKLLESQKRHGDRLVNRATMSAEEVDERIRAVCPELYDDDGRFIG